MVGNHGLSPFRVFTVRQESRPRFPFLALFQRLPQSDTTNSDTSLFFKLWLPEGSGSSVICYDTLCSMQSSKPMPVAHRAPLRPIQGKISELENQEELCWLFVRFSITIVAYISRVKLQLNSIRYNWISHLEVDWWSSWDGHVQVSSTGLGQSTVGRDPGWTS